MNRRFVRDNSGEFPVHALCRVLGLSRGGYYGRLRRPVRGDAEARLLVEMRSQFAESRNTYGRRRMYVALKERGVQCGKRRVGRLMRKHALVPAHRRKFRVTTRSNPAFPTAPNLLDRDFTAEAPNRKWTTDITYVPTREGWLYLAVVMDLYSRYVVGWGMGDGLDGGLVMDALKMAMQRRNPGVGLVHHSDRGIQYARADYRQTLESNGILCSMSRKGDCWDNAVTESFFHTLKVELVHQRDFQTRREATAEIFEYLEMFYNRKRLHSTLGYKSPADYERLTSLSL
jgi:transposase InsO family protein